VLRCIERPVSGGVTLNVGLGQPVSILAVAQLLQRIMGSSIDPHVTGQYRVGDIRHNHADIARLADTLGVRPEISVEAGMKRFCDWVAGQPIPEDMLDRANAELKARKLMA
jgi:dTDP-L-rhamnose 4-epimerase